jgi:hypothetical protein
MIFSSNFESSVYAAFFVHGQATPRKRGTRNFSVYSNESSAAHILLNQAKRRQTNERRFAGGEEPKVNAFFSDQRVNRVRFPKSQPRRFARRHEAYFAPAVFAKAAKNQPPAFDSVNFGRLDHDPRADFSHTFICSKSLQVV